MILGGGIIVLVIIAIAGMPKQQVIQQTDSIDSVKVTGASLTNVDDPSLSIKLRENKNTADNFLNKIFSQESPITYYYNADVDEPGLIKLINEDFTISDSSCSYLKFVDYADNGKTLPTFEYTCKINDQKKYIFIAVLSQENKVFNWIVEDQDSFQNFVNKVHGG